MRADRGEGGRDAPQWLSAIRRAVGRDARHHSHGNAGRLCRAWGIEMDGHGLHLVCISAVCAQGGGVEDVCIEDVRHVPLPPGLIDGTDIIAPEEVGHLLREVLCAHPSSEPMASFSMALCPSVVLSHDIPWTALLPGYTVTFPEAAAVTDALGPWIRWHAQRISGLDDADLLVDWRVSPHDRAMLTLTAAQAHYLSVRDAVADHAGVRLHGLVDAAASALRACRYVVSRCVQGLDDVSEMADGTHASDASAPGDGAARGAFGGNEVGSACRDTEGSARDSDELRLACLWCGGTAAEAWTFAAHDPASAARSCALPPIDTVGGDAWRDALHGALCLPQHRPALLIVCGHASALEAVGGVIALSALCDFPVMRFDASTCRLHGDVAPATAATDCAVALGAALHGLAGGMAS